MDQCPEEDLEGLRNAVARNPQFIKRLYRSRDSARVPVPKPAKIVIKLAVDYQFDATVDAGQI